MQFDMNTALTIVQQHGLDYKRVYQWKHKGHIPDRYDPKSKRIAYRPMTDREVRLRPVIRRILNEGIIKINRISKVAGLNIAVVQRFKNYDYISAEPLHRLRVALLRIRFLIKRWLSSNPDKGISYLLNHPLFNVNQIAHNAGVSPATLHNYRHQERQVLHDYEVQDLRKYLLDFSDRIQL